jgi:uncharacterized membrane protein YgdD (TMEM256/DUF423 family)
MWNRWVLVAACILGGSAVAMGAFQAHGLDNMLEGLGVEQVEAAKRIENCGTAVRYQLAHALAIFATGVLSVASRRKILAPQLLMMLGVCCFSGGLYEIVFRGEATHWAIVPLGGLSLISGWTALAVASVLAVAHMERTGSTG